MPRFDEVLTENLRKKQIVYSVDVYIIQMRKRIQNFVLSKVKHNKKKKREDPNLNFYSL